MNSQERFKENRHDYWNKFFLGFLGGSGVLSVIFLGLFNKLKESSSQSQQAINKKVAKSPEQFESIYKFKTDEELNN